MHACLVHHLLERSAERDPDRPFLIQGTERATYGEVELAANRLARALRALGVARGERVALLAHNSRFYAVAYYATLKAGGVAVPLNTAAKPEALARMLARCTPAVVLAGARLERAAAEACREPGIRVLSEADCVERSAGESAEPPGVELGDADLASIVYTSGSTGTPLGAMLSHGNLVANTRSITRYLELQANDRVLCLLPFFYVYGKSLLNTHACVGGSLVLENQFVYPNVALVAHAREACTGLSGVPSTFAILLNRSTFAERKLESLRYVTQAGGAMSKELTRRLADALPGRRVFVMYGATEAAARLAWLPPERLRDKLGSIGVAIPDVELRVLGPDGRERPVGEVGELVARGPNIMRGYWGDPEATARALDEHGYHTGDLAWRDEEGFFYIAGRSADFIKAGAHRVGAREIEEAILELPQVHEVAVVGLPDEILGERIAAYVVLRPGEALAEADLARALRAKLPAYKLPSELHFLDDLPKNATGKVMKRELVAR